jgi:hypothetical protein
MFGKSYKLHFLLLSMVWKRGCNFTLNILRLSNNTLIFWPCNVLRQVAKMSRDIDLLLSQKNHQVCDCCAYLWCCMSSCKYCMSNFTSLSFSCIFLVKYWARDIWRIRVTTLDVSINNFCLCIHKDTTHCPTHALRRYKDTYIFPCIVWFLRLVRS